MANCNLIGLVLAQRTKTIGLAMLGNLIPLLNPIRVAEEYAMIDVMSGGRLIAGMIRGVPHEYIAYNVVPGESRERLREAAALIVKCWTEPEPFGWEGEFYQYPSVSIWPKPYQKPHPPILMSASNENRPNCRPAPGDHGDHADRRPQARAALDRGLQAGGARARAGADARAHSAGLQLLHRRHR
jgi:alkanesulfonate monooxygenase SsuD/methylene tetrahydromethanopterin reductase-like flavin-dependent oxidoreductase (luciferase family)